VLGNELHLRYSGGMQLNRRSALIIVAVIVAVVLAFIPATDSVGKGYVDSAFKRALISFALARGLNGVISVAQGTEIAVQPAGVGVNFTPGEILDPINDMVERFSWIMMLATSSLGVQKVLLSMSAWQGLLLGVLVMAVLLVASLLFVKNERVKAVVGRVFLFLLILRFMMPAIAVANEWVYQTFLQTDYAEATGSLQSARQAIGDINDEVTAERQTEPGGLVERARDIYRQIANSVDIDKRLDDYRQAAESISENTIRLIVVFLMQTLVFPLLFLAVIFGLIRRLTRW
jgi:hypothetical protein